MSPRCCGRNKERTRASGRNQAYLSCCSKCWRTAIKSSKWKFSFVFLKRIVIRISLTYSVQIPLHGMSVNFDGFSWLDRRPVIDTDPAHGSNPRSFGPDIQHINHIRPLLFTLCYSCIFCLSIGRCYWTCSANPGFWPRKNSTPGPHN